LDHRGSLHVHGGVDHELHGLGRFTQLRKRRDHVAFLHLVDGLVILRAVCLSAPDDPDVGGGRVDALYVVGKVALPSGRHDRKANGSGTRRAFAGAGKHVSPHVEHRQEVVAALCVSSRNDHRLLREVEPRDGIERVEVRPHDIAKVRRREYRDVRKGVHWSTADDFACVDIDGLTPCRIHQDQRIKIDVRLDADIIGVLLGNRCDGDEALITFRIHCRFSQ
jgi:hypothetical protein